MFGMMGAIAMITAGNDIIRTNHVEDPADFCIGEFKTKALNL
jgi:hypothetical protein